MHPGDQQVQRRGVVRTTSARRVKRQPASVAHHRSQPDRGVATLVQLTVQGAPGLMHPAGELALLMSSDTGALLRGM